ncbi:MAG: hypothetical protein Q4C48_11180 [Lachnospiraceae bacterium]|nr:hypothetical protein [Lachnospiraceae bacterium]
MNIIRKSSEDEMIFEFLKAEYSSDRFSEDIEEAMHHLSLENGVILSADLHNAEENALRKKLLGEFRGYGQNRELFENFPMELEWSLCSFSGDDLKKIRYIDYDYWNELSGGTHSPLDAAQTIRKNIFIFGENNDGFWRASEYIKDGGTFPRMFFLTADFERFVIVEGHLRMTAYALVPERFNNIEAIVGKCSPEELARWM